MANASVPRSGSYLDTSTSISCLSPTPFQILNNNIQLIIPTDKYELHSICAQISLDSRSGGEKYGVVAFDTEYYVYEGQSRIALIGIMSRHYIIIVSPTYFGRLGIDMVRSSIAQILTKDCIVKVGFGIHNDVDIIRKFCPVRNTVDLVSYYSLRFKLAQPGLQGASLSRLNLRSLERDMNIPFTTSHNIKSLTSNLILTFGCACVDLFSSWTIEDIHKAYNDLLNINLALETEIEYDMVIDPSGDGLSLIAQHSWLNQEGRAVSVNFSSKGSAVGERTGDISLQSSVGCRIFSQSPGAQGRTDINGDDLIVTSTGISDTLVDRISTEDNPISALNKLCQLLGIPINSIMYSTVHDERGQFVCTCSAFDTTGVSPPCIRIQESRKQAASSLLAKISRGRYHIIKDE